MKIFSCNTAMRLFRNVAIKFYFQKNDRSYHFLFDRPFTKQIVQQLCKIETFMAFQDTKMQATNYSNTSCSKTVSNIIKSRMKRYLFSNLSLKKQKELLIILDNLTIKTPHSQNKENLT